MPKLSKQLGVSMMTRAFQQMVRESVKPLVGQPFTRERAREIVDSFMDTVNSLVVPAEPATVTHVEVDPETQRIIAHIQAPLVVSRIRPDGTIDRSYYPFAADAMMQFRPTGPDLID